MGYIYLTCPSCRAKFNGRDEVHFTFCPYCNHRVETRRISEDEARKIFLKSATKCNRQCEKTGYKCRGGCVMDVYVRDVE